jgi:hypothetical protein
MIDLQLTESGDLHISGSDLLIGDSDAQQQRILLVAQKGSIKQFPDTGVGLLNYLNSSDINSMIREVRHQFEKDGIQVSAITYDESTNVLTYDAQYSL